MSHRIFRDGIGTPIPKLLPGYPSVECR